MPINCIPICDSTRTHLRTPECPCEPKVEYIDPDTGTPYPNGPVVVHNAPPGYDADPSLPQKRWGNYNVDCEGDVVGVEDPPDDDDTEEDGA